MGYDGYFKLYNGAPNRDLKEYWDSQFNALEKLKKEFPTAWCTYFPMEGKYACSAWSKDEKFIDVPGFYNTVESACSAAIKYLKETRNDSNVL